MHATDAIFNVSLFQVQEGGGLMHTGAVLEGPLGSVDCAVTRYDFGYHTLTGLLLNYPTGTKYYHLDIVRNLQNLQAALPNGAVYTHSLVYKTVGLCSHADFERAYLLDDSFYFLPLNNCRHYVVRLINRLSKGRDKTQDELEAHAEYSRIIWQLDHVRCRPVHCAPLSQ